MNSEVPPIPESDYSKSDSAESMEQLDELEVESTSETTPDAWLEEDIIDVDVDTNPTIEFQTTAESEPEEPESASSTSKPSPELTTERLAEVPEVGDLSGVDIALDNNTQLSEDSASEPSTESELFVDSWLDEPEPDTPAIDTMGENTNDSQDDVNQLEKQKAALQGEIVALQAQKEQILLTQVNEVQESLGRMIEEGTRELQERKTALQIEIEKLERRKERIDREMRANFAGSSQELAIKVQGFKNYLVGSLQDLARAADKLELAKELDVSGTRNKSSRSRDDREDDWGETRVRNRGDRDSRNIRDERGGRASRGSRDERSSRASRGSKDRSTPTTAPQGQFSEPTFADQSRRIRQLIDKYRNNPDYYGSPWQLRRTFEPTHAKKVQDWFFVQGGRGAVDSMGSRLQNILVASAIVSILHSLYGDRCRVLVLTDTPENLGEWRRGLQDCLGISRSNFGSNRGVTLFDAPEVVVQRAERLIADKLLPVIIIDETEELLNLSVLKFPLWLAFASTAKPTSSNYLY